MVDLPGPTPLRRIAASLQPQPGASGAAARKPEKNVAETGEPQLVSVARELASGTPPRDPARIAELRASISSGQFRADPEQIARALLGDR